MSMTGVRAVLRRVWLETRLLVATALHRCACRWLLSLPWSLAEVVDRATPPRRRRECTRGRRCASSPASTASEAEIDRLADACLETNLVASERSAGARSCVQRQAVEGLENIRDALEQGRGCAGQLHAPRRLRGSLRVDGQRGPAGDRCWPRRTCTTPVHRCGWCATFATARVGRRERHRRGRRARFASRPRGAGGGEGRRRRDRSSGSTPDALPRTGPAHSSSGRTSIAMDMDVPVVTMDSRPHPTKDVRRRHRRRRTRRAPSRLPVDRRPAAHRLIRRALRVRRPRFGPRRWRSRCGSPSATS